MTSRIEALERLELLFRLADLRAAHTLRAIQRSGAERRRA